MRIIAGIAKGVRLKGRSSKYLRPTPNVVREGLFSILGGSIEGSSFLDLYAGTGAVGLEALSRGAAAAVFVERRPELARVIRENLRAAHLEERATVICADGPRTVERLASEGQRFDFVFADPPYYTGANEVLERMQSILTEKAILIWQHSKREAAPALAHLPQTAQRAFGDTLLTFYRSPQTATPENP